MGAVWVQFILAGPGLHDPNCEHHRPGAAGMAHGMGLESGRAEAGSHEHGSHGGHGGDHGPADGDTPGLSSAEQPASDAPAGSSHPGEDCSCLGVCVPGALVGLTLPPGQVDLAPAAAVTWTMEGRTAHAAPASRRSILLPPATGPPETA
jgi:hypothetical protein